MDNPVYRYKDHLYPDLYMYTRYKMTGKEANALYAGKLPWDWRLAGYLGPGDIDAFNYYGWIYGKRENHVNVNEKRTWENCERAFKDLWGFVQKKHK